MYRIAKVDQILALEGRVLKTLEIEKCTKSCCALKYIEFVGKNVLWDPTNQEISLYDSWYLKSQIIRKIAKIGFVTGN